MFQMKRILILFFILFFVPFVYGDDTYGSGTYSSGTYTGVISVAPPTPTPTPSGVSGSTSKSSIGYNFVCLQNSDCSTGETCIENSCVKLFDLNILDYDLSSDNEILSFTYSLDVGSDVNDYVMISYWIESDGEIIFSDSDAVFVDGSGVGGNDVELNLPSDLVVGTYELNILISYGSSSSKDKVSFDIDLIKEPVKELFDITFELDSDSIESSDDLSSVVSLISFGNVPTPISLTFIIYNYSGSELYSVNKNLSVLTEEFFRWNYDDLENLSEGNYFAILETLYGDNISDRFILGFEVEELSEGGLIFILQSKYVLYFLLVIVILITSFVIIDFLYSKDNRDIREFSILNSYYLGVKSFGKKVQSVFSSFKLYVIEIYNSKSKLPSLKTKYVFKKTIVRKEPLEDKLVDVDFALDNNFIGSVKDLSSVVSLISSSDTSVPIALTFSVIDSFGSEVYNAQKNLSVLNLRVIRWNYIELNDLPKGKYVAVLDVSYPGGLHKKYRKEFELVFYSKKLMYGSSKIHNLAWNKNFGKK